MRNLGEGLVTTKREIGKENNMRIAYADPPYIGQANKYPEKQEVDHRELITDLLEYDGWALSCSTPSLYEIIPMFLEYGIKPRIGAWVKPFCVFKPNVNPAFAWEPVIFIPARSGRRDIPTVRDWVSANITLKRGLVGVKPDDFCDWLFLLLGAEKDDEFYDLFPGSGAVIRSWEKFKKGIKEQICPLCLRQFIPRENQVLLMADDEPNIYCGVETFVCKDCYEIHSDGE